MASDEYRSVPVLRIAGSRVSTRPAVTAPNAGIARMSEVLAVEWAKFNINVNCIAPGAFDSEMMDGMVSRMGEFYKHTPRGRLCNPIFAPKPETNVVRMDSLLSIQKKPSVPQWFRHKLGATTT